MVVAEYLGADAVVVPITCNDAIDRGPLTPALEAKTRIGSPFVVAGMAAAQAKGRKRICGWEANGGFLLGSDIERNGHVLSALPTRDAFLPILGVLFAAHEQGRTLIEVFGSLPKRFSRAALLRNFPREDGKSLVAALSTAQPAQLEPFFPGFGRIERIDLTDGVRIYFENGDLAHFRPSGNAGREFRIYAVADTQQRANEIVDAGVAGGAIGNHPLARASFSVVRLMLGGLGYTAQRLARRLLVRGDEVVAVTRDPERFRSLQAIGLRVVGFDSQALAAESILVLSIPPVAGKDGEALHRFFESLRPRRVTYISSTGVYGERSSIDENTPAEPSGEKSVARFEEEQWISRGDWESLIVRAAAIYGSGRGAHEGVYARAGSPEAPVPGSSA